MITAPNTSGRQVMMLSGHHGSGSSASFAGIPSEEIVTAKRLFKFFRKTRSVFAADITCPLEYIAAVTNYLQESRGGMHHLTY